MSFPFFMVEDLSISFGGVKALEGISFQVEPGSITSIIGPNGAGKTTLFNCISGIYHPDRGQIIYNGEQIQGKRPDQVAVLGVARTFQNIELFSMMTAMENLMLGRHIYMQTGLLRGALMWGKRSFAGREETANRRRVEEIIDFLDLHSARNQYVLNLPYGTRKTVELGRALALEPKLLLLDEPTAGMNMEEKQDMITWMQEIREVLGITILLIEHDMNMIMDISDSIVVLNFGHKIAAGPPGEVQRHPEVLSAYLGEEDTPCCQ